MGKFTAEKLVSFHQHPLLFGPHRIVNFYITMTTKKALTLEAALKVHEAFHPILLSGMLRTTLDGVTKHRKDRDDAQKARLQLALDILNAKNVDLPAYPLKTKESLLTQMQKQQKKMAKKDKKDAK